MTTTPRGSTLALGALVMALALPAVGAGAQEDDSTTTTAEIETSATSITAPSEDGTAQDESAGTDDTLPFTGPASGDVAIVAYAALVAGMALLALAGRGSRSGDAPEDVPAD